HRWRGGDADLVATLVDEPHAEHRLPELQGLVGDSDVQSRRVLRWVPDVDPLNLGSSRSPSILAAGHDEPVGRRSLTERGGLTVAKLQGLDVFGDDRGRRSVAD